MSGFALLVAIDIEDHFGRQNQGEQRDSPHHKFKQKIDCHCYIPLVDLRPVGRGNRTKSIHSLRYLHNRRRGTATPLSIEFVRKPLRTFARSRQ